MDSPVEIPFKNFIKIDRAGDMALYLRITFGFINAIQTGLLPEGTRIPGSRILSKILAVNRNTLIKALADLELQGFIETLPSKGTFILSDQKPDKATRITPGTKHNSLFTFKHSVVLENPTEVSDLPYQVNDGMPDERLVQTDALARLYVSKLKARKNLTHWVQLKAGSHDRFKSNFSNFLNLTRNLRVSADEILTTGSHAISLYLVAKLLISQGDKIVVASPSYYLANMTLADAGAEIISVPVDEEGMDTNQLREACQQQKIRALYITSTYHYPTNYCLSAKRRMEILDLASEYGFVILEDDYDFDFHYDNKPGLPLAAFNTGASIIYMGSFTRSLPAGFGYGFVTGPPLFIKELEKHQRILEQGKDILKEQVIAHWIEDGEVHRLAKKHKKIYRERRDHFMRLLDEKLGGRIKFDVPARGLALWIHWLETFSLIKFKKQCAAEGLFLPERTLYQTSRMRATRFGFGSLDLCEMDNVTDILLTALNRVTGKC